MDAVRKLEADRKQRAAVASEVANSYDLTSVRMVLPAYVKLSPSGHCRQWTPEATLWGVRRWWNAAGGLIYWMTLLVFSLVLQVEFWKGRIYPVVAGIVLLTLGYLLKPKSEYF